MLICKYTRLENAAFVPHLDTLRAVTMAIRRIGADADYSEGFNPHMKIFFGQPLPIGIESECEYFCAYVNGNADEFRLKINSSLPAGIEVKAAAIVDKDPNIAKIMSFADYKITMRDTVPQLKRIMDFTKREQCIIEYIAKGKKEQKDVKSLISRITVTDNKTLRLRLCCGNKNLRADRLMKSLCCEYGISCGYDILKTNMYDCEVRDLDKILFGRDY